MKEKLRFLGLDVHAETIAVAVAEPDGEVRSLGTIPNRVESIRKMVKKLGSVEQLQACYEAGPTGYVLPTDHDYAVSTREYQTDQSSLKPAPTAARSVLEKQQMQRQRRKQPRRFAEVDTVTPYQRYINN